jgi:hypothetical protein
MTTSTSPLTRTRQCCRRPRAKLSTRLAALDAVRGPSAELHFARARLSRLLDFFELGRRFLDAFVARHRVSGLLTSIAQRAARFPALLRHWGQDVRVGP